MMSKPKKPTNTASVSLFALVMLMTGAVDGITNLPSIAIMGQQLVFFFIVASLLFLLPTGLISAELCKQYPEQGGVYAWSKRAWGGSMGALVIWLQWINTMVWFPTCLMSLVGTVSYLINPQLSHNPLFLVGISLSMFWLMTWLNMKGVKQSTKIASWASTLGMLVPMVLIISLSLLWIILGKPLALQLNSTAIMPHLGHESTWTSLTAIITAFLGMELATVHVKKIHNAHKIFPKAFIISILLIIFTMGVGSLSIALVMPHHKIVLVTGTIQAFSALFKGFHLSWLSDVVGFMLIFGSLGAMVNWLISPANGLAQAAQDYYLPSYLAQENQHGAPSKILMAQGIVVTFVCLAFFLMPSINGSYWLLLDLSTELYVIMYLFMFLSALKLIPQLDNVTIIPGGKNAMILVCLLGIMGCLTTLVVGFFPPNQIDIGSPLHYSLLFSTGLLIMCSPALLLNYYQTKTVKKLNAAVNSSEKSA